MTETGPMLAGVDGETYGGLRETHSGLVVLVGRTAYKLKKPVDLAGRSRNDDRGHRCLAGSAAR